MDGEPRLLPIAHVRTLDDGSFVTHDLEAHLKEVADLARQFADPFGGGEWASIAGLWHDLGKYSDEFQRYIRRESGLEAHVEHTPSRVDHSSAGAQHSVQAFGLLGHLFAYIIAGHHSGLLDGRSEFACQEERLKKHIFPWVAAPGDLLSCGIPMLPPFVAKAFGQKDGFSISFFVRMIFSCLVDADYLDTERFMDADTASQRMPPSEDSLAVIEHALDKHVLNLRVADTPVNRERSFVRDDCLSAAVQASGFYSLTVPTGGGKTLSSLAFALRQAQVNGLDRILYVVPYTSIIEQNADVFREVLRCVPGTNVDRFLIEHHSNLDPDKETPYSRLSSENWDAPLIVTTSVQFYESLFGNRTSACRKLHNLSRSVIILDEAQTIPVKILKPALRALKELVSNYGSTVVLCTATQPAIHKRPNFPIGIEGVREIMRDRSALYRRLKRVVVKDLGRQNDESISAQLRGEEQVLCIVNTRGHARALMGAMGQGEGLFHLSALMCPKHRTQTFQEIRRRLSSGLPCRVISTQLVEAGVDLDFPVVYRSMAGLDSIAQAAGRCNRNGRLPSMGKTYIFRSEHEKSERFLLDTLNCTKQVLEKVADDPLALKAIEHYFKLHYWDNASKWDAKDVLKAFCLVQDKKFPFLFDFARIGHDFRLIEEDTRPVVIPWDMEGQELCALLRDLPFINRTIARRAQRYLVQIRTGKWLEQLNRTLQPIRDRDLAILISPRLNYSDVFGLQLDDPSGDVLFA